MKRLMILIILFCLFFKFGFAGEFDPAAEQKGSLAVKNDNPKILNWADSFYDYLPGKNVDEIWKNPLNALGKASGEVSDIVCLGDKGEITLGFSFPIKNRNGFDFAVFENSFSDKFLELARVFVSTNGIDFIGFDTFSNTLKPVSTYGTIEPEDIKNFAGKYRRGYGTCFDLDELKENQIVISGKVDLNEINFIKIKDVIGSGEEIDSRGNQIFDPYPTFGSGGFDLDGACSLDGLLLDSDKEDLIEEEDVEYSKEGFGNEGGCFIKIFLKD